MIRTLIFLSLVMNSAMTYSYPEMVGLTKNVATKSSLGCYQCIRSGKGFEWWHKDSKTFYHSGSDSSIAALAGSCCHTSEKPWTSTTCPGGIVAQTGAAAADPAAAGNVKISTAKSSAEFKSTDMAIAACPQKQSVCGTTREFKFASSSEAEK